MSNTKIGHILSNLLTSRGLNISELARLVNLPQPTIHRIASGAIQSPHLSSLKPIADYFSITIEQLKGLEPIPEFDRITQVPLLTWEESPFGNRDSNQKNVTVTDIKASSKSFALKVMDASMEPVFPNSTLLIVDPERTPKDRSYIIVKIHNQPTPLFRQLIIDANNLYVKPLSPDLEQYRLAVLNKNDQIIGVVIQTKHNLEE